MWLKTAKVRNWIDRFLNSSGLRNLEIFEGKAKAHLVFYSTVWQDQLHLKRTWQGRDLPALKEIANGKDYPSSPSPGRALVLLR